jgi:tetratricopeptide (TPR) repeat protein
MAPLAPMTPGRCLNCGDRRKDDGCENCGLSREEDLQVHDELRQMIAGHMDLLQAAREASRQGRRLLGLKLATAAASETHDERGDIARALRVWLLAAIGEPQHALNDAQAWVESQPDPAALAWASLGQQQQQNGFAGAAADSYSKALDKDPDQLPIRARRAQLMIQMQREGQALSEAVLVLHANEADEKTIAMALDVAEQLCNAFEERHWDAEIEHMVEQAGYHVDKSALLLAHRARVSALNGRVNDARRDLKRARALKPDLPIYQRVQRAIKPQRNSWWRW